MHFTIYYDKYARDKGHRSFTSLQLFLKRRYYRIECQCRNWKFEIR